MTPEECASIRSIARWVLPVLVGPSTAVTPAPGARSLPNDVANDDEEEEKAIFFRGFFYVPARFAVRAARSIARLLCAISLHFATPERPNFKFRNESGTNREG